MPPGQAEEESSGINPLIFIIPSLAAAAFLLLFFIISRSVSAGKYKRMNTRDKFRHLARQNLKLIGYLGLPLEEGETLSEYSARILKSQDSELKEHIGFIPLYEAVLYSDREMTGEELRSAEMTAAEIRRLVKKRRLRNRFLLLVNAGRRNDKE